MKCILIVEDDPALRDLLIRIVRRGGYATVSAADGQEALLHARRYAIDLILMDLVLPVLDGWNTIKRLKSDPRTAHVPVFAVSGRLGAADEASVRAAGCVGLLSKPFDVRTLLEQIAAHVACSK